MGLASFLPSYFYDQFGVSKVQAGQLTMIAAFLGAALRVEPEAESILGGLLRAGEMPEGELVAMRGAACRLVAEHYSARAVADKTMALYQQALFGQADARVSDQQALAGR